ncbi:TetR/AcrR family transcriptional regulator [Mediterraneibacter agrestimuris]|uniref:TetR/AcrR family transcriptional regulator n=1 Tax=Mediterraneibacter agrestimuris TaxID=2941333 RepID=UPI0020417C55|nr:TetR/AcrR family transcriptional regulator [Mediterraneibacter agrestimuris]
MGRENKKEAVATLHREQIMKAAEQLFSKKGFAQTTIDDISKASEYSRRTIYSYYESKEDILHHIIEKGLVILKQDIQNAINLNDSFIDGYKLICMAMRKYQVEYPHSVNNVNTAKFSDFDIENLSETIKHILILGTEINTILAEFIEKGKEKGIVRQDIVPMLTVYILWSSITSFLSLAQTKGQFISKQFSISENEFLDYGFKQIINSILEVRI